MKHKLKISRWENGSLNSEEYWFDSLVEAIENSKLFKGIKKIYNELEELIFIEELELLDMETYA